MAYDENGNYDPSKVRSGSKWWEAVQRTGMVTDHQLSVRGGNDKTNFTFSGSYYDYKGLVKDEEFSRYSIRGVSCQWAVSMMTTAIYWKKFQAQTTSGVTRYLD